jgi:hypothetical protein
MQRRISGRTPAGNAITLWFLIALASACPCGGAFGFWSPWHCDRFQIYHDRGEMNSIQGRQRAACRFSGPLIVPMMLMVPPWATRDKVAIRYRLGRG